MIVGVGVDIIKISRIKQAIINSGDGFIKKVFTCHEINYCKSQKNPYQHYAARFAAKESIIKALSNITQTSIGFNKIEIINNTIGSPEVKILKKINLPENIKIHLSLSHFKEYAVAFVVIEKI